MNSLKSILNRAASYVQPVIDNAKANMPNGVTASKVIAVTAAVALAAYVAKRALTQKGSAEASTSPSIKGRVTSFYEKIRSTIADFAKRVFSGNGNPADFTEPSDEDFAGNESTPSSEVDTDCTSDSSTDSGDESVAPEAERVDVEPEPTATPVERAAPVAQGGEQRIQLVISGEVPAALTEYLKSVEGIQVVDSGETALEMKYQEGELTVGNTTVARKSESAGYIAAGVLHLGNFEDARNHGAIAKAILKKFGPKKQ